MSYLSWSARLRSKQTTVSFLPLSVLWQGFGVSSNSGGESFIAFCKNYLLFRVAGMMVLSLAGCALSGDTGFRVLVLGSSQYLSVAQILVQSCLPSNLLMTDLHLNSVSL